MQWNHSGDKVLVGNANGKLSVFDVHSDILDMDIERLE